MKNMQESVAISGITEEQIRQIVQLVFEEQSKKGGSVQAILLDVNYLYTFAPDDFFYISRLCKFNRFSVKAVREWHRLLERWYQDQTVRDDRGLLLKPLKISRSFDRVPNEGLEGVAGAGFCGEESRLYRWHAIGSGNADKAYPSDQILVSEIERIDVLTATGGGSVSRDGSTVHITGQHTIDMPDNAGSTINMTETGVFTTNELTLDKMGDHSFFSDPIPHDQGEDAPGSTTIIYPCSG